MRNNNKGFITTTIVFSCLIVTIALIFFLLNIIENQLNGIYNSDYIKERINHIVPYDVKLD